jgi:hypothetical protein
MRAVAGPPRTTDSNYQSKNTGLVGGLIFLLFELGLLAFFWYWLYPASWYASWYDTDADHVIVRPKPRDCDFSKAPLGDKECHYEKHVEIQRDPKTGKVNVYVYWEKVGGN